MVHQAHFGEIKIPTPGKGLRFGGLCLFSIHSNASCYGYKEKALEGGNRGEAGASKRFGDARETAKRNCAHARREYHDLAPVAQGAAGASARIGGAPRGEPARSDARRGRPNCRTPARKFTVAATVD